MAKLCAYGQTEIWRIAKDGVKYACMHNGRILKNMGHGWKVAHIKEGLTPDDVLRILTEKGYERISR